MNVVAVGGAPGVGKSEIVRLAIELLREQGFAAEPVKHLVQVGERRVPIEAVELRKPGLTVIVLGRYDEGDKFPGTDCLSMSVQPAVELAVEALSLHAARSGEAVHVLFEGDRLFSKSFLLHCAATQGVIVRPCLVRASGDVRQARLAKRGSSQSATWLKGRDTKIENVLRWLDESGEKVTALFNEPGLAGACAQQVIELLGLPPFDMDLRCPECACSHVDEGEFETLRHRRHRCTRCGHEWRPYEFATRGVDRAHCGCKKGERCRMCWPFTVAPKVAHCKKQSTGIYVGRPSKWGNPFTHLDDGTLARFKVATRDEAVSAYEAWVVQQPELMAALPELRGHDLLCWCAPKSCHADVLLRLANPEIAQVLPP